MSISEICANSISETDLDKFSNKLLGLLECSVILIPRSLNLIENIQMPYYTDKGGKHYLGNSLGMPAFPPLDDHL